MRFATFNLLHGRSPDDNRVDLDRLRQAIRELDADILALQEVDRDQPRSHLADLTAVAAQEMGAVSHRFVAALAGTPGATWMAATGEELPGAASYGIALLSRFPARRWHVTRFPRIPFRFPMYFPNSRRVGVVHEEPRAAVIGEFDTPAGPLVAASTHLSFVPGWNRMQLRRLRRDLAAFPSPAILLGDFNMTPPAPEALTGYRSLVSAPTFPHDAPDRQLDHILLRGELGSVTGWQAPLFALSDHRALVVDVAVAGTDRVP